jgi:hypothetical protein
MTEYKNDRLTVNIETAPGCLVKLDARLSPKAVEEAYLKTVKDTNKQVSIPGFRKGKAPNDKIIKEFEAANPGITISREGRSVDEHKAALRVAAQSSDEGQRRPGAERHTPDQSLATWAATIETSHVGVHRRFVDEDKTRRVKQALLSHPAPARTGYVRSVLLGCP